MKHLRIIRCVAACLAFLVSPALAQNTQGGTRIIALPGSSGGGTFPPSGCSTANGIIFNNATPCDSGLTYAGSGGPITSNGAIFGGAGAADFQFGAANVNGSPVAQTLGFQGALAGSASNTASASTTIIGSLGTGTGTNGDIIFQTGVKTTTGTAQATPTTAVTIKGETGALQLVAGSQSNPSVNFGTTGTGVFGTATSVQITAGGNLQAQFISSGVFNLLATSITAPAGFNLAWGANDTTISRSGAGVLRIGASASTATGSLLLTNITASGAMNATGLPTSTPGGTPSTVCWDSTAGAFWTDASATGPCGIASALRFKNLIDDNSQLNLAGLDTLRTGPWQFKPDSPYAWDTKTHVSLIADQVAAMDPRCATYDKDGAVLNYEDRCVIAYLVGAVKSLRMELQTLHGK